MHLFHKWETISKRETKVNISLARSGMKYTTNDIPAIVEIQRCKICPKGRAFVYYNGIKVSVNPDLWRKDS